MKGKTITCVILSLILAALMVSAVEFSPQGNVNLKSRYNITNGLEANISNINSQYITATNVTSGWFLGRFNWTVVSSFFSFNGVALDFEIGRAHV